MAESKGMAGAGGACWSCATAVDHCHGTLVLHADGGIDCDEVATCGADPGRHEWWLTCAELAWRCSCTGDDHPLVELSELRGRAA